MADYILTHTGAQIDTSVTFTEGPISTNTQIDTSVGVTQSLKAGTLYASQAEAEAGTSESVIMNPLRTKQAIDALAAAGSVKNLVHNPRFNVNQRNVSGTVTLAAGAFGHDRWKAGASGCTYTFATSQGRTTLTITAGSLVQTIDGLDLAAGVNTHTLSWGGTCQGKIGSGSYGASGVTVSATGGTNINVEFGIGTLYEPQFEVGTVASQFDRLDYPLEIQRCQYYYNKLASLSYLAYQAASSSFKQSISFPRMRGIPTPVTSNISYTNSSAAAISGVTASSLQFGAKAGSAGAASVTMDVELTGLEI